VGTSYTTASGHSFARAKMQPHAMR
jgi:hypothetical protein